MGWDFTPTEEQGMLVDSVRQFMAKEIFPHEREIERRGEIPIELGKQIQKRAKEQGLHAANMPEEAGGGGLDFLSATLMDRELGKSTWGLVGWVGRPSEILNACQGDQRETYLLPTVRGERKEALRADRAECRFRRHEHPDAGDIDGSDYLINGSKHFISCVTKPDFVILFTVTGIDKTPKGERKRITCFLVDVGHAGVRYQARAEAGQPPRLSQLSALVRRLPRSRAEHPGRGGQGLRPGRPVAVRHAHPHGGDLLRQGRARAADRRRSGRRRASSSARHRHASRA